MFRGLRFRVEGVRVQGSADLGGRVGWLPKAERVKTLFLSPLQPEKVGGVGGGGGVGGVSRLRFPPGPHLRSSRFSRHPRLRQAPTRRFAKNRNLRGLGFLWGKGPRPLVGRAPSPGGPGPKPPGDLAHRPLGPGSCRVFMGRPKPFLDLANKPEPCIPAA